MAIVRWGQAVLEQCMRPRPPDRGHLHGRQEGHQGPLRRQVRCPVQSCATAGRPVRDRWSDCLVRAAARSWVWTSPRASARARAATRSPQQNPRPMPMARMMRMRRRTRTSRTTSRRSERLAGVASGDRERPWRLDAPCVCQKKQCRTDFCKLASNLSGWCRPP